MAGGAPGTGCLVPGALSACCVDNIRWNKDLLPPKRRLHLRETPCCRALGRAWLPLTDLSPLPPAPVHGGLLHAQTGDRGLPEEVQRQEETEGNRSSASLASGHGVAWFGLHRGRETHSRVLFFTESTSASCMSTVWAGEWAVERTDKEAGPEGAVGGAVPGHTLRPGVHTARP